MLSLYHHTTLFLSPYHCFFNPDNLVQFHPPCCGESLSPCAIAGALLATLIWFGLSYLVSSVCLLWLTVALILVFTLDVYKRQLQNDNDATEEVDAAIRAAEKEFEEEGKLFDAREMLSGLRRKYFGS